MATALFETKIGTLADKLAEAETKINTGLFGKKVGLIGKIFGCGHGDLSRPFSQGKIGYRSCLRCGAVKQFNPETLKTYGEFYYPSIVKPDKG